MKKNSEFIVLLKVGQIFQGLVVFCLMVELQPAHSQSKKIVQPIHSFIHYVYQKSDGFVLNSLKEFVFISFFINFVTNFAL